MKIVTFENSYIDEAAVLLSKRHLVEREYHPELPEQFENPDFAKKAIVELLEKDNRFAVAAIRDTKLIGYMIGTIDTNKNRERHTWIDYAGFAISKEEDSEIYRYLYASISTEWVKNGSFKHYVVVPSGNKENLDAWLRLGFAYEQVHGIQSLTNTKDEISNDLDFTIQKAQKEQKQSIREIATIIMEHQAKSPVWAPGFIEERGEFQDGYVELIEEPSYDFWLAVKDDQILGFQVFSPVEASETNMLDPKGCISLVVGGTVQAGRGKGVGTALVNHGFTEAIKAGFTTCSTDWRITNLESSRFWPKSGFKPIAYRLVRQIDPRVSWAKGKFE